MNELERDSVRNKGVFFRHGKTYFRAVFIKSRKAWRFYWLNPTDVEVRSRNLYPEIPKRSRRLKTKPSKKTLAAAWLIK